MTKATTLLPNVLSRILRVPPSSAGAIISQRFSHNNKISDESRIIDKREVRKYASMIYVTPPRFLGHASKVQCDNNISLLSMHRSRRFVYRFRMVKSRENGGDRRMFVLSFRCMAGKTMPEHSTDLYRSYLIT